MKFRHLAGLLLGSLLFTSGLAQSVESPARPDSSITSSSMRALQFSYSYMNPVSYRGRTFGVHQFGMMPQLTYQTPGNWHLYSVGYIWNNFQTSELGKIDLGIEKEGKLGRTVSYTLGYERWLFPNGGERDAQPLSNFTEAYLSYEWHDWSPAAGFYYMFGSRQLLQTDLELNRYVGLAETGHWSLFTEPLLKAILANQNSVINGLYTAQPDHQPPLMHQAFFFSHAYGLVDVEANVPVTLQTPRWSLVVDPRVAQPFHTLPGERTRAFFYAVATLTYTLPLPHPYEH